MVLFRHDKTVDRDIKPQCKPLTEKKSADDGEYPLRKNVLMNTCFRQTLLSEGLSEPEFYGDLVYKLKKLKGINDFSLQFGKNHITLQTYRL